MADDLPWRTAIARILQLFAEFEIADADGLKHTLEDHARWRRELLTGQIVEMREVAVLWSACQAALDWTALDGDGISDPVRQQLLEALRLTQEERDRVYHAAQCERRVPPQNADAVDPHAADPGMPSTRD